MKVLYYVTHKEGIKIKLSVSLPALGLFDLVVGIDDTHRHLKQLMCL